MKILYTRGNLNRKLQYQVATAIYQSQNNIIVRKYAVNSKAQTHLDNLHNISKSLIKILSKNILLPKMLRYKDNYIEFEYVNLPSLESVIEKTIINHQFKLTKNYLLIFKKILNRVPKKITNPYKDKQFIEIFDPLKNYQTRLKEKCIFPGILDLNLDNLIYDSKYNKIYLIDWEWTYDFPISESFASFRSLFYLSFKLQSLITTFCSIDFPCYEIFDNFYIPKIWWDMFSFSQEDAKKFLFYEFNFQNSVNIIKVDFKKINIFKEKKLINKRVSLNLESYIRSLISQKILDTNNNQVELEGAKKELAQTKIENKNLEKSLNQIKSAKFFKLWQGYCKLRDSIIKHHKV